MTSHEIRSRENSRKTPFGTAPAVLAVFAVVAAIMFAFPSSASADGDENCESTELCVHDVGNPGPVWSTPWDELNYAPRFYDSTGNSVNNTARTITNLGVSCDVNVFPQTFRGGTSVFVPKGYVTDMAATSIGNNNVSSHDFCFVA